MDARADMSSQSEDAIRIRAYYIWEGEGRPHGRALDHWLRAETEARNAQQLSARPARARKGR